MNKQDKKIDTLKTKITQRYGTYRWFRMIKYIKNNPLFFIKKSFYKKIRQKIKNKLNKQNFSLVIFDDTFPSIRSAFRYEEYRNYFKKINSVYVLTTGMSLGALKETRNIQEVIQEFEQQLPEFKSRVFEWNSQNTEKLKDIKNKLSMITFLQNLQNSVYDNLALLEKYEIPFIFTLYPGGGFILNDKESDDKLKRVCSSKYFQKVIVTQQITYNYLIEKGFCKKEQIEFIYGVVTPKQILNNKQNNKRYYQKGKDTLDICFVAHKYSEKGIDKGYDLFIEVAKKLASKYDKIKFHVIGGFSEKDIEISELGEKIKFYGIQTSEWLRDFYKNMDLILSPNRPFQLSKGSFDGFPTGACTEAMINGVVLLCTDELKQNIKFEDKKDLIIIKPEVSNIVETIEDLYHNPYKIIEIARQGRKRAKDIYKKESQIKPRIKLIKKVAKQYYK